METMLAIYQQPKYFVTSWYNKTYLLTAEELLGRIERDSRSDYNWLASATELWRTINSTSTTGVTFPREARERIAELIVQCFANIFQKDGAGYEKPTDCDAVSDCYYVLPFGHPVRDAYLKAIIKSEIRHSYGNDIFGLHSGKLHTAYERTFVETELEAAKSRESNGEKLNFAEWHQYLYEKYTHLYKKERDDGLFKQDDIEHEKNTREIAYWVDRVTNDM